VPADDETRTPQLVRLPAEPAAPSPAPEVENSTSARGGHSRQNGEAHRAMVSDRSPYRPAGREPVRHAAPATEVIVEDHDVYREVEGEPLLTADELRALLQDPQETPPSGKS
jgi:hypothetical protein